MAELMAQPCVDVVRDGDDAFKVENLVFISVLQEVVPAQHIKVDGQLPTHPVDDAAHLHDGHTEEGGNLACRHPYVVARQLKSFVFKHDEVSFHHSIVLHLTYYR